MEERLNKDFQHGIKACSADISHARPNKIGIPSGCQGYQYMSLKIHLDDFGRRRSAENLVECRVSG
jgi:hypothetical protein